MPRVASCRPLASRHAPLTCEQERHNDDGAETSDDFEGAVVGFAVGYVIGYAVSSVVV